MSERLTMDRVAERLSALNADLLDLLKRWDDLTDDEHKRQVNIARQSLANFITPAVNWHVKARANGVVVIRARRLLAVRHFVQKTYHCFGHWLRELTSGRDA